MDFVPRTAPKPPQRWSGCGSTEKWRGLGGARAPKKPAPTRPRPCKRPCSAGPPRGRAKPPAMRDLVVREALEAVADDAADRLRGLIATGHELPYEVREPGDGSPLVRYEPRTEDFVYDHAGELRELDSFGTACAALEIAGLGRSYLELMGIGVPEDARKRAEIATLAFLCRLWLGSSDFTIEDRTLAAAIDEVESGGDVERGQIEVIVPLRGLQMPVARLDLEYVSIVRS